MPIDDYKIAQEPRNVVGDWAIRLTVGLVYVVYGAEKFSSGPDGHWVKMFREIGWGDGFRYFAGVVEILGGLLVMIPPTKRIGLAVLAATMASAVGIVALVLHHPGQSIFPGLFLIGLLVAWWAVG
jgi:uncharacterized membrane protein YphA (DoxX/SURF4 family)